ncbi:MAG: hypothetical protein IK077_06775 [Thermoguttaceae bacterium]|nr:hypothetical protein [Thermoguttaceae bacterium]
MADDARPVASLNDANEYFAGRLYADAWTNAPESERTRALTQASYLIAGAFAFRDAARVETSNGAVRWHERVAAAICEEALWLLKSDPTQFPQTLALGITRVEVANLSATFDRARAAPLICDAARRLLTDLADYEPIDDEGGSFASTPLAL